MDRNRPSKDQTPPPLLLMPPGGGLTLDHTPGSNLLMPVNAEASLLGADDSLDLDAEPDSFIGQSPPTSLRSTPAPSQPSVYFQHPSSSASDPFASIGAASATPPIFHSTPMVPPQVALSIDNQTQYGSPMFTPTGELQMAQQVPGQTPVGPPKPSGGPPQGVSKFRRQERPRYVAPPDSYGQVGPMTQIAPNNMMPPQPSSSTAPLQGIPSQTYDAPSQGFGASPQGFGAPPQGFSAPPQGFGALPQGFGAPPQGFGAPPQNPFPTGPPPVASVSPQPQGRYNSDVTQYQPIQHHWFYSKSVDLRIVWKPFSIIDSLKLEQRFIEAQQGEEDIIIATDGGRYDVNITQRHRMAIYWDEPKTEVRRCSWFYKNEMDNKFVPYDEEFSSGLENEYKNTVLNNLWHKRLEFPNNEVFVMHNPSVIVNFLSTAQPDQWGTTQEEARPKVVKRGCEDIEQIDRGESENIDHLVLFVHGIGPICDFKFRGIVECVDDFRAVSHTLMSTHFNQYSGRIGRVEYLPVYWYNALHGEATGVDRKLGNITLKSIGKLRRFTNDVLLDILFYTAPKYCQTIADTVTSEVNRLYNLFCSRNPNFKGQVSLAGHSLGSLIVFDLLSNQKDPHSVLQTSQMPAAEDTISATTDDLTVRDSSNLATNVSSDDKDLTLEDVLEKLSLSDYLPTFRQEKIDMETLSLCDENDIKEMGLPMGPRKKLRTYLQEHKEKEIRKKQVAIRRAQLEQEQRQMALLRQQELSQAASHAHSVESPLLLSTSLTSVDYVVGLAGTGQPHINYAQLGFRPSNFFALGSPIAMFLTVRGIENIGEEYRFPTCQNFFHIFHPFDPVAYRIEPLISPSFNGIKPLLMPHHKGRKRLHLELKEGISRVGADIKQKIIDSVKSTWSTINAFARAHKATPEQVVEQEVDSVLQEMASSSEEKGDDISSVSEDDLTVGSLNQGRRIDHVLQESPIESFNDYLFALSSHGCYWESEDTVLMFLKEIYTPLGFIPHMPGSDIKLPPVAPPPMVNQSQQLNGVQRPMPGPPSNYSGPKQFSAPPVGHIPPMGMQDNKSFMPPVSHGSQAPANQAPVGPPPLTGFVKR